MRPPDLPGGNRSGTKWTISTLYRFNEAAGFTRRKPTSRRTDSESAPLRFNEAAGFTRRKHTSQVLTRTASGASMRPPDLPGGNGGKECVVPPRDLLASMRPPDLPGGNSAISTAAPSCPCSCFNEAAGFTRRKQGRISRRPKAGTSASMRPPDLPGGNAFMLHADTIPPRCFNEAAGFTRRKRRMPYEQKPVEREVASMRPPDLPGGNISRPCRSASSSTGTLQ